MKLIVGCGYLGRRVAQRWLAAGHEVAGVVRRPRQADEIAQQGLRPILADVTRSETLPPLPPAETVLFSIGYDPAGGKSRWEVHVDGLRTVLDRLTPDSRRLIFISSTGVYGEAGGNWVDEDSLCRPTAEGPQALLAAEELLAAHPLGRGRIILRLAGLYGPGRLPPAADLLAGRPMPAGPGCTVNLIHVDDAATVILAAEARCQPPRTYVVSDGCPVDRREYLRYWAELLEAPTPSFLDSPANPGRSSTRGGNKRVNNARMLAELGVQLAYPSFREGLAASLMKRGRS